MSVPPFVQLPLIFKSPPAAVDRVSVVDALMVMLPLTLLYWVDAAKFTLVDAVVSVTLNGTPWPELALAVHSTPAAYEAPVL